VRARHLRNHSLSGRWLRSCLVIARIVTSVYLLATSFALVADTPLEPDEYVVFHHHDALGNTVVTTGANGEVLWFEQTEPYGKTLGRRNVRGSGLAVDPFHEEEGRSRPGYTGHVRDGATGLTYMQARHYDPELGRFLSNDLIGVDLSNPQSFNRYAYANNNPYRYVDPDGRLPVAIPFVIGAIGGGLTAYDTYDTYQTEGAGAAAKSAAVGAGLTAAGVGAAKAAGSIGKRIAGFFRKDPNTVKGYRAVSKAEAHDIEENGFRPDPNGQSMEDTWFSESREGAEKFQQGYPDLDVVVETNVPSKVYDRNYQHPNIDDTGPGFCVSCDDLDKLE